MKKLSEYGGVLAQLPVLLFVLIYLPFIREVDWTFYLWQGLLCAAPIVEHFIFLAKKDSYDTGTQWNVLRVFYIASFLLTVWNCSRFQ